MSANGMVEKKAMTEEELSKYIKAAILGGVGGAGIGAIVRRIRERKERAKESNPENHRSAIVIPIKKTKFMEDLPTPNELAKSRGEFINRDAAPALVQMAPESGAAESEVASVDPVELTAEQIAAKKKEIIGNGRKFDFFGKRASGKTKQDDKSEVNNDVNKVDNRTLLRDQDGKFVSPTDPVAVAQTEKDAFDLLGIGKFVKNNFRAAFDKPVMLTAGALGSLYIAEKISDAINERRREKSKDLLESAREEYVGILEGNEKKADWDTAMGTAFGAAFFVPAALTALVANRVIENRKIENKKRKEMSDSYPDDPIILYKTSEAKDIPISPETAMAMYLVKRAMIKEVESDNAMSKFAQLGLAPQVEGYGQAAKSISNAWKSLNSATRESAMDDFFEHIGNDKNSDLLLNLVKSYGPGGTGKQREAAYGAFASRLGTFGNWWKGNDKFWKDPGFRSALISDPRTFDILAHRFNNNDKYIEYRNSLIDHELGKTFKQGGFLHSIISWIMRNTGIGAYMFNNRMKNALAQAGRAPNPAPSAKQNSSSTPGAQGTGPNQKPSANGGQLVQSPKPLVRSPNPRGFFFRPPAAWTAWKM